MTMPTSMPIDRAVPSMIFMAAVDVVRVQVFHLGLRDLLDVVARDRRDLLLVGLARPLGDLGGSLQQTRGRRRLGDEGEGAIGVDRDLGRNDQTLLLLRAGVERLAELHDVHAVLAKRRTDRAARDSPARRDNAA